MRTHKSRSFSLFKFELRFYIQRYFFVFAYLIKSDMIYATKYFTRCRADLLQWNNRVATLFVSDISKELFKNPRRVCLLRNFLYFLQHPLREFRINKKDHIQNIKQIVSLYRISFLNCGGGRCNKILCGYNKNNVYF